jgi:hypothetical protein
MASRPPEGPLEATPPTDQERARYVAINIVRLTGVAMVLLALLILGGTIDLPRVIGWIFLPMGLVDVFVLPLAMARKWRTPRP